MKNQIFWTTRTQHDEQLQEDIKKWLLIVV